MNHETDSILLRKLLFLRGNFNFNFLVDTHAFSHDDIKRYYKKTKYLLYRWAAGSKEGFMHLGISEDGIRNDRQHYQSYQVEKIDEIIKENNFTNVLELGSGQGANLGYLSSRNENVSFYGLDLYPSIDKKFSNNNITLFEGDYHDLSKFEDNSLDLVYAIETLCYSTNKNQIFKEVSRVLKKDGLFIIFDGYLGKDRNKLTSVELFISKLVESGYYLDEFESIGNINNYISNNNFKIVKEENMKNKVLKHLYHYQDRINNAMKHKFLFKLGCASVSKEVLGNLISIYFMADTIDFNISVYYFHILKKN